MRSRTLLLTLLLAVVGAPSAQAWTPVPTARTTPENVNYKDSYYYYYNGVRYLAVSDLTHGGISILRDYGADNNFQRVKTFYNTTLGSNAYAPSVMFADGKAYLFYTQWVGGDLTQAKLRWLTFDPGTFNVTYGPVDLNMGSNIGVSDPEVWYDNGRWYMAMAKHAYNPYTNTNGFTLYWSYSTGGVTGPYTTPQVLKDTYGAPVDKWRTDIKARCNMSGNDPYFHVVEGPRWSWWTETDRGNPGQGTKHRLYWSIGFSDAYCPNGTLVPFHVHAIRRGIINYSGVTPVIDIIGRNGGADDLVGQNEDNLLFTHPDFTANGLIRATGHRNGFPGVYSIVNSSAQ